MNSLSIRKFLFFLFIFSLLTLSANAQVNQNNPGGQKFRVSQSSNSSKIKKPKNVVRTKKKQEANDRRLKKEYDKSVLRSQKRTVEIQTPDVQERMKQNKKDYIKRDKEKKKKVRQATKEAGGKYN